MLLEARGITKSFEGFYALRNVSFGIAEGETLGLVGESGCGKSTLAKILSRIIPEDSGSIEYQGAEIMTRTERNLKDFRDAVQIIFQSPFSSFDPRMTFLQSMTEALSSAGVKGKTNQRGKATALFKDTGLGGELLHRFPHEVSGGECQRAAIARALSRGPKLLICDEVVSSLDLLARAGILNLFLRLQRERGLSLIFIAHDLRVVRHLCDRVLVMKEGEICETLPTSQLVDGAQHPHTLELLYASGLRPKP